MNPLDDINTELSHLFHLAETQQQINKSVATILEGLLTRLDLLEARAS